MRTRLARILLACLVVLAVGLVLAWVGGCKSWFPRVPAVAPPPAGPVGPPAPTILKVLVPDTSETFWILRVLSYAAFTLGFFAIIGAIASRVVGLGLMVSNLLIGGVSCIAAGVGMAALQYFLQAYLRIVVFGTLILGVCALIPLYRAFYNWARIRLGIRLADEGDVRAGVSHIAAGSPRIKKVRKAVLGAIEKGFTVKEAVRSF